MSESWVPPTLDAWAEKRIALVGASEYPALEGALPFMTYAELWARKSRRPGFEDSEITPSMLRGQKLEGLALDMLSDEHPGWGINRNVIGRGGSYVFDSGLRMGATPDAFVYMPDRQGLPGLVEVKSVEPHLFNMLWRYDSGGEIVVPTWVKLQTAITARLAGGIPWAAVLAIRVGHEIELDFIEVPLLNDQEWQRAIQNVHEFWSYVDAGKMPPIDYKRDGTLLRKTFPEDDGSHIEIDDRGFERMLSERARIKSDIGSYEKELQRMDAMVVHRMGNAATAVCGAWRINMKTYQRGGYTVQPGSSRMLRITPRKEGRIL